MTPEELKKILDDHKLWVRGEGGARANLSGANLSGANLSGANLSGANLSGADLSRANLTDTKWGDGYTVTRTPISMTNLYWPVWICDSHMHIGCQQHTHAAWEKFDDEEISSMHSTAIAWWKEHKEILMRLCEFQRRQS